MESTNLLEKRLTNIENLLLSQKTVLTFDEFCIYCNISKSYGYKLTSQNQVPHFKPNGKMVYFDRIELDLWLKQNRVKTTTEINNEATNYVLKNSK